MNQGQITITCNANLNAEINQNPNDASEQYTNMQGSPRHDEEIGKYLKDDEDIIPPMDESTMLNLAGDEMDSFLISNSRTTCQKKKSYTFYSTR